MSELTFERWSGRAPKSMPSPLRRGGEGTARSFPASEQGATGTTSRLTGKTIFCNSGFEAVEAALKTALLATGRKGIIAFAGGYHGLGYGALNVTHRSEFRSPFAAQLGAFGQFLPFPEATVDGPDQLKRVEGDLQRAFRKHKIGAVLVEPIQGRAGIRLPPPGFLPLLRRLCDEHAALLIVDEVFTGFGRTGRWFACEHSNTMPDLICLGKALTGGFPLSACVGKSTLMDRAWPKSTGEALHTSTFLGHPVGCAMALAQIHEIRSRHLVERSADLGKQLLLQLGKVAELRRELICHTRGSGLMVGLEWRLRDRPSRPLPVMRLVKQLLRQGFIFLPEGAHGEVLSFTPPLIISPSQIESAVRAVASALQDNKAFP